jgi:T-complex protein 1 subunit theta
LPKLADDFDQEYIRVTKILGSGILDSRVISGLVVVRNVEGSIERYENPKVAVYNAPLDP